MKLIDAFAALSCAAGLIVRFKSDCTDCGDIKLCQDLLTLCHDHNIQTARPPSQLSSPEPIQENFYK